MCAARLGNKRHTAFVQLRRQLRDIIQGETRVPKNEVVRFRVTGQLASARRRDVFEELDARPAFRAQSGDMQPRTEDLVQMLLLDAVILAFTGNAQTEQVAIEREALVCV